MEHFPEAPQESDIPQEAGPLADWIDEELGDEELAHFLREHPEGFELCANGESMLPRTVFDLAQDLSRANIEEGVHLVEHLHEQGMLPVISSERIVGNINAETKEQELLGRELFVAMRRIGLESGEDEKQVFEYAMIDYANRALDELRARFGMKGFEVPPESVRLTSEVPFVNSKATGEFFPYEQEMHSSPDEHPVHEMSVAVHEMTHFKSYGAIQIDRDRAGRVVQNTYRIGMNIRSRDGKKNYLTGLNEAVTEETTNRVMAALPEDHPILGPIAKNLHQRWHEYAHKHEAQLAEEHTKPHWLIPSRKEGDTALRLISAYTDEKIIMEDLFEKLIDRNPERFAGKTNEEAHEALFEMLQKAMFTGNILPFGRLFNDTFGHGKFREYGHLQTNEEIAAFIAGL